MRTILGIFAAASLLLSPAHAQNEHASQEAIDAAIDRGLEYLQATQELDGSWRFHADAYPEGQTALCLYTLLKGGLARDHPSVRRARAFLGDVTPNRVYSVGCLMMALQALDPVGEKARLQQLADLLVDWQSTGFGYPGAALDMSNTQYAALGLRAAANAGCEVPAKSWDKLIDYCLRLREEGGRSVQSGKRAIGFTYREKTETTGSMTAAGISILCIARDQLVAARKLRGRRQSDVSEAITEGLNWLGREFLVDANPIPSREGGREAHWHYYYLYGVERVGGLAPTDKLGEHDWYRAGADFLVGKQGDQGQWAVPGGLPQPNTCFGVLFLRRATAPSTGKGSPGKRTYGTDDPEVPVSLRAAGDTPLQVWVSSYGAKTIDEYEWVEDAGQGPRVARVEYLNGDTVVAEVLGDGNKPAKDVRFPTRLRFDEPGARTIRARIHIVPPGEPLAATIALDSPAISVTAREVLTDWMLPYATDRARNLLTRTRVDATASSSWDGNWAPGLAVDGLQTRGWLSKDDDAEPALRLDLDKPQKGNVLLLSHARAEPLTPNAYARATRLGVSVNKRKAFEVVLEPNEQRKTEVVLPRVENIRRLEFFVLERTPGKSHKGAVGLMEVELVLEKDRKPEKR